LSNRDSHRADFRADCVLRRATIADIAGMHRVRTSVRENALVSVVIADADYREHIETLGRGWVVAVGGEIVGFAIANARDGNVWALFVHPDHERRGYGRQLHDAMVAWMGERGVPKLWLTTAAGTRAERFYEAAGWARAGLAGGELRFELRNPRASSAARDLGIG
jgi:GNAT superfamily N-acetyltransferase